MIAYSDVRACRRYHEFNIVLNGINLYMVDIAERWEYLLACDFCYAEAA